MDEIAKIITLLLQNPLLLAPAMGLVFLLAFGFAAWKKLVAFFEAQLTPVNISQTFQRVVVFLLIQHLFVCGVTLLWFYFATDYFPPTATLERAYEHHPLGAEWGRPMSYLLVFFGWSMLFMVVALRFEEGIDKPGDPFVWLFQSVRLWFVSVLGAYIWVIYDLWSKAPVLIHPPPGLEGLELILWTICAVPVLSFLSAVALFIPFLFLRWLWKQTQRIQ